MSTNHVENHVARETAANKYIIFAVNKKDGPFVLGSMQKHGINYKVAQGYYQGTREDVFIVNANQFDLVYKYLWWAIQRQESILHLGPVDRKQDARPVVLEYIKTTRAPVFLGYFYAVPAAYALRCDAWTNDCGQYYVAALERPAPLAGSDKEHRAAAAASNASVCASNRAAVRGHTMAAARGALHHATKAYAVGGHFNRAGKARTSSGHEF